MFIFRLSLVVYPTPTLYISEKGHTYIIMSTIYSLSEVEKHNVKGDLWLVIEGKVYNVTTFAADVSFMIFD